MWRATAKRYFALKLPLAVEPEIITFVYADPGHQTHTELHAWGAAHGPLWDALRKKGRQVRVVGIAVKNAILDRTDRVLEKWAAAPSGTSHELTPKQEINLIREAMRQEDREFLAPYGDFGGAMQGLECSTKCPKPTSRKESRLTTMRHGGPCALRIKMRSAERTGNLAVFLCHGASKCL